MRPLHIIIIVPLSFRFLNSFNPYYLIKWTKCVLFLWVWLITSFNGISVSLFTMLSYLNILTHILFKTEIPLIIVSLLTAHSPELRALAAEAIGSFALSSDGINQISSTNATLALSEMLRDRDMSCKKESAKALYHMSQLDEGTAYIISTSGCVQLICKAIVYPSIEVCSSSLFIYFTFFYSLHNEFSSLI